MPLNPRLEKLRVDLEGELEKKAERRDRYLEAAEVAKDRGFPEVHEKLRALAEDEESHLKVLREILAELR